MCGALRCRERVARPPEARGRCASAGAVRGGRRSFLPERCGCYGAECVVSNVVPRPCGLYSPGRVGAGPGRFREPEAPESPAHGGFPAGVHAAGPPRRGILAVNHSQRLWPVFWQTARAGPGLAGACSTPSPNPQKSLRSQVSTWPVGLASHRQSRKHVFCEHVTHWMGGPG